jgi:hypothetical protein
MGQAFAGAGAGTATHSTQMSKVARMIIREPQSAHGASGGSAVSSQPAKRQLATSHQ